MLYEKIKALYKGEKHHERKEERGSTCVRGEWWWWIQVFQPISFKESLRNYSGFGEGLLMIMEKRFDIIEYY